MESVIRSTDTHKVTDSVDRTVRQSRLYSRRINLSGSRQASDQPTLLAAVPFIDLHAAVTDYLEKLRELVPNSDAITALEFFERELASALRKAKSIHTYMSIGQLADLINRPESTISRMCRERGASIGARKVNGVWQIHWPSFEANVLQHSPTKENQ